MLSPVLEMATRILASSRQYAALLVALDSTHVFTDSTVHLCRHWTRCICEALSVIEQHKATMTVDEC